MYNPLTIGAFAKNAFFGHFGDFQVVVVRDADENREEKMVA